MSMIRDNKWQIHEWKHKGMKNSKRENKFLQLNTVNVYYQL